MQRSRATLIQIKFKVFTIEGKVLKNPQVITIINLPMNTDHKIKYSGMKEYLQPRSIDGLPRACNYCDDVFAELADVTFMDA